MNRKMVLTMLGKILRIEAFLLVCPLIVSLIYRENTYPWFLLTIGISLALGILFTLFGKSTRKEVYAKEGFVVTAMAWIGLSLIGALPFTLSGEIPSYIDAVFETVSGFTTTGASILTDVEAMSHGMLFWRSFTHWVGGMGILVLMVAITPSMSDHTLHVLRAEMPGPTMGKLVPKLKDTARILYYIYIAMTAAEVVMLLCGGMPLFDSLVHTFGTAGTGGFGIKANSLAGYSNYCQWVITVFMVLFGVNFNVYYLLLIRRFRAALRSTELWVYLGILFSAVLLICLNIYPLVNNLSDTIRLSAFQVSSIMTTTGYSTTDFNQWPEFSKTILVILMFIGACAGSTAGGLKVSRVVLLVKTIRREFHHMLHPRSVGVIMFESKRVDTTTLFSVATYFALYIFLFGLMLLLLSLERQFDFVSNFTAVSACFNNIGPGLGMVGPASSFAAYSNFSKILLSFAMLLGRLELYPILLLFTPSTWIRK